MNCKSAASMMSAYLDRELVAEERDSIRAHLADCERCRAEERDLRALKGLLLGVRAPEPATGFEQRLISRLRTEATRPVRSAFVFPKVRPLALAPYGGLVVAAALALFVVRGPQVEETRPVVVRPYQTVAQNVDFDLYAQHGEAYEQAGDYTTGAPLLMPNADVP